MAVYVDKALTKWKGMLWCHLVADSLDELHEFAIVIGMKQQWFQEPPKVKYPHYDIPEFRRVLAIKNGAVEIGRRELIEKVRKLKLEYNETK